MAAGLYWKLTAKGILNLLSEHNDKWFNVAPDGMEAAKAEIEAEQAEAERRRQKIERDIERAEASLRDIEAEMEKNASDYQKLLELGAQKDAAEESLGTLYAEWETLAE